MSKTYPSQNLKQVLLRIPEEMRAALQNAADENGRSLTAEVLARLETTFPKNENWRSKLQQSPQIQMEKRLIGVQSEINEVRGEIDHLITRIAALEKGG